VGSTAELVLLAAAPWSTESHALFPQHARQRAVDLVHAGWLLSRSGSFDGHELALTDIWRCFVLPHAVTREPQAEAPRRQKCNACIAKEGRLLITVVASPGVAPEPCESPRDPVESPPRAAHCESPLAEPRTPVETPPGAGPAQSE